MVNASKINRNTKTPLAKPMLHKNLEKEQTINHAYPKYLALP
jgi:hypothetical protein